MRITKCALVGKDEVVSVGTESLTIDASATCLLDQLTADIQRRSVLPREQKV
jgi:hypothetical protein